MKETGRLEAFSDGVFAIAMTLLALELKVPHFPPGEISSRALAGELAREWPGYLAFITSFFTVLIMWVHHHIILKPVHRADPLLLFTNGLLLLLVTAVPFPTAVVAEYLQTPAAGSACMLYAGVFVGISVAFYLLLLAAFRKSAVDPRADMKKLQQFRRDYLLGPPGYLAALGVAPFEPLLTIGICSALWIFWAITTHEC
jgi:uncharacterized membrane protein